NLGFKFIVSFDSYKILSAGAIGVFLNQNPTMIPNVTPIAKLPHFQCIPLCHLIIEASQLKLKWGIKKVNRITVVYRIITYFQCAIRLKMMNDINARKIYMF